MDMSQMRISMVKSQLFGGIALGIGYIFGCLLSILLWKINRQAAFKGFNGVLKKILRKDIIVCIIHIIFIGLLLYINTKIVHSEIYNFITAFLVIDISSTERENLSKREKVHFYDSISTISKAIVCGFTAPLMYIVIFGNIYGILYMVVYNLSMLYSQGSIIQNVVDILNIIPCVIVCFLLYFLYIIRNKKIKIDYKGDFARNLVIRPLLNIDILAANLEFVNFYYYYSKKEMDYVKSYGCYSNKIDEKCIKDYLGTAYGLCLVIFVVWFILIII